MVPARLDVLHTFFLVPAIFLLELDDFVKAVFYSLIIVCPFLEVVACVFNLLGLEGMLLNYSACWFDCMIP